MEEPEPKFSFDLIKDEEGNYTENIKMQIDMGDEILAFKSSTFFFEDLISQIKSTIKALQEELIIKKQLNDYLMLKFENGKTNIYVLNPETQEYEEFRQCKYALIQIPEDQIEEYDEIKSIDEALDKNQISDELHFDRKKRRKLISPEQEFFVHASNLQAWIEHDYDTRLLHRNMAFPLLKKLSEAGDLKARDRFKDQVAFRIASEHKVVFQYLEAQDYLDVFSANELYQLSQDIDDKEVSFKLLRKAVKEESVIAREDYIDLLIERINHDEEFVEAHLKTEYKRKKIFDILDSEDLIEISKNLHNQKQKDLTLSMIKDKSDPRVRAIFLNTIINNLKQDFKGFVNDDVRGFVASKDLTREEIRNIALKLKDPIHKIQILSNDGKSIFNGFEDHYYENDLEKKDYGFKFQEFILTHLDNPDFDGEYKITQSIHDSIRCKVIYKDFLDFGLRYLDRKVVYRLKYIHLAKKIFNQSKSIKISVPVEKGFLKIFDEKYKLQILIEPEYFKI